METCCYQIWSVLADRGVGEVMRQMTRNRGTRHLYSSNNVDIDDYDDVDDDDVSALHNAYMGK